MKKTCKDIRREFLEFFQQRGHTLVPSGSLLPAADPTLLFTNAGMNQFKDIFLGRETRAYKRAADSQKCIRAGGKHNDLEDVGHDTYHHTFFEMLGNWSFGDYFKTEAISWAWELLTKVWAMPPERLHATYFGGDAAEHLDADTEARDLWLKFLPAERVHPGNKKDNFWEMGETGPCGPCSEIHYDFTPDLSGGPMVNKGDARVIEIWNLVFIQFNRGGDGKLTPLPAKHVDTGMGFERACRALQGVDSNYDIDVFRGLFDAIQKVGASKPYAGTMDDIKDVAYRVIADHARALTFAIADGITPSNEGRGYVLRRILRRAARYGRQYLDLQGPFIVNLVPTVVELMGESYPEIAQRQKAVTDIIRSEEESFGKTLDRGIDLFQKQVEKLRPAAKTIPGDVVFELYATYGFPVDLTQIMATEQGMSVDLAGYEAEMVKHKEISGAGDKFAVTAIVGLPATDDSAKYIKTAGETPARHEGETPSSHAGKMPATHMGRMPMPQETPPPIQAMVLGWVLGNDFKTDGELNEGDSAAVVLGKTNFYGEQGGQVGDKGLLTFDVATDFKPPAMLGDNSSNNPPAMPGALRNGEFRVEDSVLAGQCVLHFGTVVKGTLKVGATVTAHVDASRIDTMRNHTATHLLNWALREVLGDHVNQAGSVVAADRLRFDFSHGQAMTAEELERVETMVNEQILKDLPVTTAVMPLAEGKKVSGVRAVFGEKYPDPVRVVMVESSEPRPGGSGSSGLSTTGNQDRSFPVAARQIVSAEFCGGTHLSRTGQVGLFKIVSEESTAKGVRRVTALTGRAAVAHVQRQDAMLHAASQLLRCRPEELPDRLAAMQKEIKDLKKRPAGGTAAGGDGLTIVATLETAAGKVLVAQVATHEQDALRTLCDVQRNRGFVAIMVGGASEDKVTLVAMVDEALAKSGKLKAGDWVKVVAPVVGGAGGGKPTLAQAGGKLPQKLPEALQAAATYVQEKLA
jgi:alanyl-tRNA synthetase